MILAVSGAFSVKSAESAGEATTKNAATPASPKIAHWREVIPVEHMRRILQPPAGHRMKKTVTHRLKNNNAQTQSATKYRSIHTELHQTLQKRHKPTCEQTDVTNFAAGQQAPYRSHPEFSVDSIQVGSRCAWRKVAFQFLASPVSDIRREASSSRQHPLTPTTSQRTDALLTDDGTSTLTACAYQLPAN
jgi:hypothetical protein